MACTKQYYAKNGQESKLFNQLRDQYGENRAEEIYLKTYTPEFKEWFGDWENSTLPGGVDENGEPMVYWHGSNQARIEEFIQGVNYFTSDKESAEDYGSEVARERGGKLHMYPVFIRMRSDDLEDGEIKVLADQVSVKFSSNESIKSLFNEGKFSSLSSNIYMQKMTPEEHAYNLRQSAEVIGEPNKDTYSVAGQSVERVSKVVDSKKSLEYRGDEVGSKYADFGTKYHKMAEIMIQAVGPAGVPAATIAKMTSDYDIKPYEMGYVQSMKLLIENLQKQGGVIMSETRIASTGANKGKGVAGTVDIIHIRKDGFTDIYDIKTSHETAWKRNESEKHNISKAPWDISDYDYYKAQRYSHQLMLYSKMLESSDDITGRKALSIRNVYVIPVEVYYHADDSIRMVQMLRPENIKKWSVGKRVFAKEAQRWADAIVSGKKAKGEIEGLTTASTVDEFLPKAIGVDISTLRDTDAFARDFVERHWAQKKFKLNDKLHAWRSDDKMARIAQVKEVIDTQDSSGDMNITNAVSMFFNGESSSIFGGAQEESGLDNPTGIRLAKILSTARAVDVKPLHEIPGFEMYEDISLILRADGTYDMLKFSRERIDETFAITHTEKNLVRNMVDKAGELATNSILGNHITPEKARALGITLRNSMGDYHRMRMGLVAMELASAGVRVNRIIVDGLYNKNVTVSRAVPAFEIVDQIKKMYELPNVKPLATGSLKELLDKEESYNIENFKGDPVAELVEYLENQLDDKDFSYKSGNPNARAKIQSLLRQFKNDELTKDNLAQELMNQVKDLRRLLRLKYKNSDNTEEAISADPEFRMLAHAILDLKSITFNPERDISNEFFGFISKFLKTPHATGRQTVDKTFDIIRQFHDNVKQETVKFLEEKKPYINQLIRNSPLLKRGLAMGDLNVGGSDTIFAMGQSVFDNLFQTTVNKDGVKGLIPVLKSENDSTLTTAEKEFIRYFNKTMQKYNKDWPVGYVPLMNVSANTLLYRGKKNIISGNLKQAGKAMSDSFVTNWQTMSHRGRNILDEGNNKNSIEDQFNDRFTALLAKDGSGYLTETLNNYGLDENMQLVDPAANEGFETNLEQVMTAFATHYIKKQQYDKALPAYQVMRSIIKTYEMAYGLDQTNTLEMLDTYVKDLVFNIKQADDKVVTAAVTAGVNSASIALLAFNVPVYVNNALQMWSSGFIDSLTNTMTKDPRFPGVQHFSKAATIMIQAMNPAGDMELAHRLRLMKDKYLPDDMSMLTGDRNKKTSSGLINTQLAFTMDRATEYTVRTQHLVAQMLKDGSFEAHKAVQVKGPDGFYRWELQYDPKLDKRFEGEEGKMLYERLKETQEEKGELLENGELSMAYDWRLRQRLAAYINRQIGTYDKDLGSHVSRFSIAYALTQFRTWFRDAFVRSTKIEYDAQIFGNYVRKGNEVVWENDTMKGILWTMADLYTIAKKYAKERTIEPADKRNLIFAMNSTAAMFTAYVIIAAIWDDEKDVPPGVAGSLVRFYDDTMKWATLGPYTSALTSPIVFISYYQRMFGGMIDAMSYGFEGENEKMRNAFYRVLPKVVQQTVIEEE